MDETAIDANLVADTVTYSTAVRLSLPGLPAGVKQQIWRDRQIQTQAYNWGVEHVLQAHYRGATVPNPRNNSQPLTKQRRETASGRSLLLQRGGYWTAVTAAKKWSKHRRQLTHSQRKAAERIDNTLTKLDGAAQKHTATELQGLVTELANAVETYRGCHQQRVDLTATSGNTSTRLWPSPPVQALLDLSSDGRSEANTAAAAGSDTALETFNATMPPTSYKLTFANGANDTVRANKVFVFERGSDIELLFANVSYTTVPPDDDKQCTGTIVKRILIADDVVQKLLGELRSLAEPDTRAQPKAPSAQGRSA